MISFMFAGHIRHFYLSHVCVHNVANMTQFVGWSDLKNHINSGHNCTCGPQLKITAVSFFLPVLLYDVF